MCVCFPFVPLQLFLDYTAETYAKFMQGNDTFEDDDDAFLTKLSECSIYFCSFIFKYLIHSLLYWSIFFSCYEWKSTRIVLFVFAEKLYNVDEALLASMEEKHKILSDEVERLEKENQTVRDLYIIRLEDDFKTPESCALKCWVHSAKWSICGMSSKTSQIIFCLLPLDRTV